MLAALAYVIFAFIELLVGFRFVLLLIGANPGSAFVTWVYQWSQPLVAPFAGIFGQHPVITGPGVVAHSLFDWTALIALAFYALVAAILGRLFAAL